MRMCGEPRAVSRRRFPNPHATYASCGERRSCPGPSRRSSQSDRSRSRRVRSQTRTTRPASPSSALDHSRVRPPSARRRVRTPRALARSDHHGLIHAGQRRSTWPVTSSATCSALLLITLATSSRQPKSLSTFSLAERPSFMRSSAVGRVAEERGPAAWEGGCLSGDRRDGRPFLREQAAGELFPPWPGRAGARSAYREVIRGRYRLPDFDDLVEQGRLLGLGITGLALLLAAGARRRCGRRTGVSQGALRVLITP